MKKYNYFDDDYEEVQNENVSAADKMKLFFYSLSNHTEHVKAVLRRDGEIIAELQQYPNLRKKLMKWAALLIFILALIICVCIFSHSVNSLNRDNERFCTDAGKVCTDYIAKYGACRYEELDEKHGKNLARMTGVSYARRMDFNGDGTDELVLCYLDGGVYYMEVWGYDGKALKKLYADEANSAAKDSKLGSWVVFYRANNRYYFGKSTPEEPDKVDLYTLKGKKFKKADQCIYNVDTGVYSKDDKANTTDFERVQLSYIRVTRAEIIVDMVTAALEEFKTKSTVEIEAALTEEQLKNQAYYEVVDDLIKKYGAPVYAFEEGSARAKGLAVVEQIDFNGDGNKELLVIFRREVKKQQKNEWSGEHMMVKVPIYSLRVYNWNGSIAKCIFSRDNICKPYDDAGDTNFYILKKVGKHTDLCFNTYDYQSQSVYTASSRIFRLKGEKFSSVYDARMEYEYGYRRYYLDNESVYSATFETKGYEVPYFCNDDAYDTEVYTVTYLSGGKNKSDVIKDRIGYTNLNIQELNDEYIVQEQEEK